MTFHHSAIASSFSEVVGKDLLPLELVDQCVFLWGEDALELGGLYRGECYQDSRQLKDSDK